MYLLFHTFINVQTSVSVLFVSRRTHADIAALSVDTVVMTDVLTRAALVDVSTCSSISVQLISRGTATLE